MILKEADRIRYIVKADAPNDIKQVLSQGTLTIWSGESSRTIWGNEAVNHAFRAIHDALHFVTRLGFSPNEEIELGRIQASKYDGLLSDLVYIEVAKQAEYFLNNGVFVVDQIAFTKSELKKIGYNLRGEK